MKNEKNLRALVFERDEQVRNALTRVLESFEVSVSSFANGDDALRGVREAGPDAYDIILLDHGIDHGFYRSAYTGRRGDVIAVHLINKYPNYANNIYVLIAASDDDFYARYQEMGLNYLQKPISKSDFEALIRNANLRKLRKKRLLN